MSPENVEDRKMHAGIYGSERYQNKLSGKTEAEEESSAHDMVDSKRVSNEYIVQDMQKR